jgi:transposase
LIAKEVCVAKKDMIIMRPKELRRLYIIRKVLGGEMTQVEASEILGISERQVRRVVRRVWEEGDKGVIHRSRGQESNRKLPESFKREVIEIYRERYEGFGPTLSWEKLKEREGIKIGKQTLRNWLLEAGEWHKVRKRKRHRQWRERKAYYGEMVQIDGSHHDWLEGRGPELVLMGYVDDATNHVHARFYDYEGTLPAMDSFKRYVKRYGLPVSVYLDKHSTYKSQAKLKVEDTLWGRDPKSQFERALEELGVRVIHAHSPQAKGRIERLFRTFQDRVIKEMRLRGIRSKEGANRFLGSYLGAYNRRFSVEATKAGDLHRPIADGLDLDEVLCIRTKRAVRNDLTIVHDKQFYQIMEAVRTKHVFVEERISGVMLIKGDDKYLRYKKITSRPAKILTKKPRKSMIKNVYLPPKEHPWKKFPAVR